ncbi:ATP-binding protein [Ruminococcaceae bacterium OttesenSCG-928-A16]|nr:ATP-binding protein [Eubacteriales bacterium OttesenSCG-928-N13]MDL2324418.1 ATP-binding protein [Ruminococcaceae bacterium OttesenSCG-928-A16]
MIYVITGLMASGKSTVAEQLAKEFPKSVHLRGDVFRKMIVSGGKEMSDKPCEEALSQLELRYRLTAQATKEYHKAGFTVIVQDNYYGEMLPRFLSMLEPEPVRTIVLCPDVETIRQREDTRPKTGYIGFDVEALHGDFMATTPRIGLWIDNSRQMPEETVGEILRGTRCT